MVISASFGEGAQLALDTLMMRPAKGIPQRQVHIMQISEIDRLSGCEPGAYLRNPADTYLQMQRNMGTCFADQFIPLNPLSMSDTGFNHMAKRAATTGAEEIRLDDIMIDSPEAVVAHMERFVFPQLHKAIEAQKPDDENSIAAILREEQEKQDLLGPDILNVCYGRAIFPRLRYTQYGYINYFLAYQIYPEVMEKDFALQADLAERSNGILARALREGRLPPVTRLDHDMADGRGTLVDIRSLDRIWFPHFSRCIEPLLRAGIRLIWHCDGNLMQMVPRLIAAGIGGFQGFQYEQGMDYEAICRMGDRNGDPLMIWAGVSVSTTLPFGSPEDVVRELRYLVENGPPVGLSLCASSSVTPGVTRENLDTLIEGLRYYRIHGRRGLS